MYAALASALPIAAYVQMGSRLFKINGKAEQVLIVVLCGLFTGVALFWWLRLIMNPVSLKINNEGIYLTGVIHFGSKKFISYPEVEYFYIESVSSRSGVFLYLVLGFHDISRSEERTQISGLNISSDEIIDTMTYYSGKYKIRNSGLHEVS